MSESIRLPDLELASTEGTINLAHGTDDWLLLYFYPKDSTPGCTTQANEFSQMQAEFQALKVKIIGVSRDSLASHQRFIDKQNINFCLISDADEQLCQHFAVIKEKNMYGKKVMGIERSSFLFHQGQLQQEWRKVKAAGHAELVLDAIRALQQSA